VKDLSPSESIIAIKKLIFLCSERFSQRAQCSRSIIDSDCFESCTVRSERGSLSVGVMVCDGDYRSDFMVANHTSTSQIKSSALRGVVVLFSSSTDRHQQDGLFQGEITRFPRCLDDFLPGMKENVVIPTSYRRTKFPIFGSE
jgi:hypothetical protein